MISRELLSEVIGTSERDVRLSNNTLICLVGNGSEYRVNIYELQNLCKEWAFSLGYQLHSYYNDMGNVEYSDCKIWFRDNIVWSMVDTDITSTEPEAVFKACQWILENKEN